MYLQSQCFVSELRIQSGEVRNHNFHSHLFRYEKEISPMAGPSRRSRPTVTRDAGA